MLLEEKERLRRVYGLKSIGVFGSYARGENTATSDLDLLVEFERPIGLLKFIRLEQELSDALGVKVEMVTKKALKPRIGDIVLKEVVQV